MTTYLRATAIIFGLLVVVHLWRAKVEGWHLFAEPFFLGVTLVAAVVCAWAVVLLRRGHRDR